MQTQTKPITQEVLEQYRERKISAQTAAHQLDMSYSSFTRLASEAGIPTSASYEPQSALVDSLFGPSVS